MSETLQMDAVFTPQADMLELTSEATFVRDLSRTISSWSAEAEALYGWTRLEALGQAAPALLRTLYPTPLVAIETEVLRDGGWAEELAQTCRDGTPVTVASRWTLERDAAGRPLAIREVNTDITQRQRTEAGRHPSELRYRRLFEAARDGILLVDPHTRRITEANPFMAELLGYARDEFVGKELWEVGLLADQAASQAAFRALQADGFIRYENLPLETRAGERRDVEFISNVYEEAGQAVIQCNIRDITARHQAEAERAALLAQAQAARTAAEAALHSREVFLTSVTHDLLTPLTVISLQAQVLRRQVLRDPTRPCDLALLDLIRRQTTRMRRLIDQLLDSARLQAGQALPLQFVDVDLAALVERLIEEFRAMTMPHVFVLEIAEGGRVVGNWDADRLEQVLGNLLSNAVKYSPNGGAITVALQGETDTAGAWAVLAVQDEGLGIPTADLPHVFERFHRGNNVSGHIPGMGIGLAGARAIVEQHGGTLQVASQEGVGSRFTVRLPLPQ